MTAVKVKSIQTRTSHVLTINQIANFVSGAQIMEI